MINMSKIRIILFLLLCSNIKILSSFGINGPVKVDGGSLTGYTGDFSGIIDFSTKVVWKVTHGRFNNPLGPTSVTQTVGENIVVIIWDDSPEKGIITATVAGMHTVRLEVDINSVKDMHITDFRCNGNIVTNDVISLPLGQSGVIECSVNDLEYPITHLKIYGYRWDTPESWGRGTFTGQRTVKINYDATTGNGQKISVTPIGYGDVLGNTRTVTIKRETPAPPPFDGNIKNVTITSNKTYNHSTLFVEDVIIKSGANVIINGYESIRIVPGFTAEQGSTLRIYNGFAPKIQIRSIIDGEEGIGNDMGLGLDKDLPKLYQNYPSPARSITTIPCIIPEGMRNAYIHLYNLMGVLVQEIPVISIGENRIDINTSNWTSGLYIYSLVVDGRIIDTKRMIVSN